MAKTIYGHIPPFQLSDQEYDEMTSNIQQQKEEFKAKCSAIHDVVKTGIDATLAEREKRYGDYGAKCCVIQALKGEMRATQGWHELTPDMRESLEMIQHKIGRILTGDPYYHDSWHDIVGYAKLVADRLEKKE